MRYDENGGRLPTIYNDCISGFFGPYRFLSNFQVCVIEMDGLVFSSSEAAYMSRKTDKLEIKKEFTLLSPSQARKRGQEIELSDPEAWEFDRVIAMYDACWAKFFQNEELGMALVNTGTKRLDETNDWGDKFWGVNQFGDGRSMLGKVLMSIREKITL